jgi:hypothetical protein
MFHHSQLKCDRLQKVVEALREAGSNGLTTLQINELCCTTRGASDVSEARACGVDITCEYVGLTKNGRRLHRYYLAEFAPKDLTSAGKQAASGGASPPAYLSPTAQGRPRSESIPQGETQRVFYLPEVMA